MLNTRSDHYKCILYRSDLTGQTAGCDKKPVSVVSVETASILLPLHTKQKISSLATATIQRFRSISSHLNRVICALCGLNY